MRYKSLLAVWLFTVCTAPAAWSVGPPSLFLDELTWMEVRDAIADGYTTIILPTGGTEQNGPHMVLGKHNVIVRHAAGEIARRLGNALVAPVLAYVPQGTTDPPSGHMRFPGTITLPEDVFARVVEHAARSFRAHGFRDIVLIADSGGNVGALRTVSEALNTAWQDDPARVHFADEFMRGEVFRRWLLSQGETAAGIGSHAGIMDTSVAMAVDPALIRRERLASGHEFSVTGVSGDPTRASEAYGRKGLAIQVDSAVAQIRRLVGNHDN